MATELDCRDQCVPGGYFLLRQVRSPREPFVANGKGDDQVYRHCFTYARSAPSIKSELLKLLAGAKRKVFITSFRIGDEELLEAIYHAAERLRGGVYLITALDEKSLARGLAELDDDSGGDVQAQNKRFEELTGHGIYVRGHSACHAKFAVVDDNAALVSSANLETRAFHDTGENGVVVTDPTEVVRLARLFTRLWQEGCDWEVPPGQTYTVQKRKPAPCSLSVERAPLNRVPGIIWTNGEEHGILETIHDTIATAKSELVAATFSLNGMCEQPELLVEPLRKAIARGVRVRMLVRARNNVANHRRDARMLTEQGVEVYADSLNHAKCIIADGRRGALFSANFDADHGLLNGVEVGVQMIGQVAISEAVRYFEHAMRFADLEFVVNPTQSTMNARLGCRWRHCWPIGDVVRIQAMKAPEWERFCEAMHRGPILYSVNEDRTIAIKTGTDRWRVAASGVADRWNVMRSIPSNSGGSPSSSVLLEQWLSARGDDRNEKGFCSCVFVRAD